MYSQYKGNQGFSVGAEALKAGQKPSLKQVKKWYQKKMPVSFTDNHGKVYEGKIEIFQQIGDDDALMFIENAQFGLYLRNVKVANSPQLPSIFVDADSNSAEKVGLKTGDKIFWVNKQLLSQKCNYFNAILLGGMKESNQKIVDLSNTFSPNDLQLLLRVLNDDDYDSLNLEEATMLLSMADFLGQDDMIAAVNEGLQNLQKQFFRAVRMKDYEKMKDLLNKGQDIQQKFGEFAKSTRDACTFNGPGDTPLTYAVHTQDENLTKFLLENGAYTAVICRDYTPLMEACVNHNAAIAQLLLEHGAKPNFNDGAAMKSVLAGMVEWRVDEQEKPARQVVHMLFEYGYQGSLEDIVKDRKSTDPAVVLFTKIWEQEKALPVAAKKNVMK